MITNDGTTAVKTFVLDDTKIKSHNYFNSTTTNQINVARCGRRRKEN
jgi:hypothetical protein